MAPYKSAAFALVSAAALAEAAMGPAFSTGPVGNSTFIREATATLVLPAVPSNNNGDLSLWVGMGTSNGDLVQSIAENYKSDSWSVYAYTLLLRDNVQSVAQAEGSTASATQQVTMHYKYDDASKNYTQTVSVNNNTVSELSTSDEEAQGWGSAVECAETNCGIVPAHKWINCKIIMDGYDNDYDSTMGLGTGVTGDMSTSDGGKTWNIGTISIPEFTFS